MTDPEFIPADSDPVARRSDPARNLAVLVYILQGLSFFLGGITGLVGVIINYVKMDDVRGTWIEPHFRWQIRTFWIGLLWTVIGIVTTPLIIGWFVLLGISIWLIFRIVKGALALNDGKAP
ncbi:hypothetical protein EHN06_14760 [Marinobacter sp. NP-4(2019)]|uniref:DUF4870 family protein n=1 Tax=Marinobacter sp. NP-4(2019) TaxID=2488665 RepID=UPI000FC3E83F|nr:hypothetical protein [Marinobacter sp. NP-4(2019)]AZT84706.1 hypothetical protein EHN06_14760 [Marinobacter sp. NP-4(2019)]